MSAVKDVIIVGAGPYGLSIAAHLRRYDVDLRVVGRPMESWLSKMPKGMLLKSAGFSSSLSDPANVLTLRNFCATRNIPYEDLDFPIPLETFCDYGLAFQKSLVPEVEQDDLVALTLCAGGFQLDMASGSIFTSRKVVIAVGIDHFRHIPEPLTVLPKHLYSHSADHHDLRHFTGREVAVLGSGASAVDLAVLLHETGASVRHVVRRPELDIGRPWRQESQSGRRFQAPISGIGPGWRSWLCTKVPGLYRYLPDELRLKIVKTHLGSSGGWCMRERAAAVPLLTGNHLLKAQKYGERVQLHLRDSAGTARDLVVDHVIAATGYDQDVSRLPFMPAEILNRMDLIGRTPRLSSQFESSIKGLYFAGVITAPSFGPAMRFVAGAEFASRRISAHLAHTVRASRISQRREREILDAP
jgi:cation diffusion facilitator CzcD-associated flavoprotein CzcO